MGSLNGYIVIAECEAESVHLSETRITLMVGEQTTLNAYVLPEEAEQSVIWSSSDSDVASVEDGTVTAKAVGLCTITASTENGLSASCQIICEKKVSAPGIPDGLQAFINEEGNIQVSWSQTENATGYQVLFSADGTTRSIKAYGVDNTSGIIPGTYLPQTGEMTITVKAFNTAGVSGASAPVAVVRSEERVLLTAEN